MDLASANFHTGRGYGLMCPQSKLAFSVSSVSSSEETEEAEEAPTFGRGSSRHHILFVKPNPRISCCFYDLSLFTKDTHKTGGPCSS